MPAEPGVIPPGAMQSGQSLQRTCNSVHTEVIGTMAKAPAVRDQVLHHDEALAAAVSIPVRVVSLRCRHQQLIRDVKIETRLELANVAAVKAFRPVGLEAYSRRNTGLPSRFVQIQPQT